MARYPAGYSTMDYNFDFFNYAGIHRPVSLYTTPLALHIRWRRIRMTSSCRDITTSCLVAEDLSTASLQYSVEVELGAGGRVTAEDLQCTVQQLHCTAARWSLLYQLEEGDFFTSYPAV